VIRVRADVGAASAAIALRLWLQKSKRIRAQARSHTDGELVIDVQAEPEKLLPVTV
jgi:hypothetical protein